MDLQSVKFVNIFRVIPAVKPNGKPDKRAGQFEVADIPITSPQKIRAYVDMGDLQPKNAANNDHGWRLDPQLTAKIRDVLEDPERLEQIAKATSTPLDILNAFHVLMYEITRNRALATRAAKNSFDKEKANAEYERQVEAARDQGSDDFDEDDDSDPAPGTGKTVPSKEK
jgi:hypothetical protein